MERRTAEMAGVEGAGPVLTLVEACCNDWGLLSVLGLSWAVVFLRTRKGL